MFKVESVGVVNSDNLSSFALVSYKSASGYTDITTQPCSDCATYHNRDLVVPLADWHTHALS